MDITLFIDFLVARFNQIINLLNTVKIGNGGILSIGLFSFMITLIAFALAVSLLWKGVKK